MKKYLLEIIVFICGAVVMVLELVGSRVLAPYLGTSIFVWTSLIGIILGSLSIGYWWGGKVADKKPDIKSFSLIILLAGIAIGFVVLSKDGVLGWAEGLRDIRLGAVAAAAILFAPASILLGMVSPYAVKLKIHELGTSGATVGRLYAISTIGSIFGTFLTGFFLISWLGNTKILIFLAIILILTSILACWKDNLKTKFFLILLLLFCLFTNNLLNKELEKKYGFVDIDTAYGRFIISRGVDPYTKRPTLNLINNRRETQSAMFSDKDDDLVFEYTKFYRLGEHFFPNFKTAALIGGGAYSFPKNFLTKYQSSTLDVIEIDPALTALAKKYFNLKDDPRLNIIHEDGRVFLNKNTKKYDVVYGDAFRSFYAVPQHLTTVESVKNIFNSLNDGGVVLLNIISAIEGERGEFLRAEYATYRKIFPQVYIFPVTSREGEYIQNIVLVALKSSESPDWQSKNSELDGYLKKLWTKKIPADMPVLTDDFAPVDQYIMKLM